MSKWVIENVEVIKKTYVVEAYGEPAAKLAALSQAPDKIETIGEMAYSVTAINEYEYHKDWSKGPHQKDWVQPLENRDRLKGPALNEIW